MANLPGLHPLALPATDELAMAAFERAAAEEALEGCSDNLYDPVVIQ